MAADNTKNWLDSIKIEIRKVTTPDVSRWTICRVPDELRGVNKDSYIPRVVSIGPAHHRNNNLQNMEKQKLQYAQALFNRGVGDGNAALDDCAKLVLDLVKEIHEDYEKFMTRDWEDPDLARIMLIDGCFILELFLRYDFGGHQFRNDPIFTTSWMLSSLQRDLLLLENQIPIKVLHYLYQIVRRSAPDLSCPLNELALNFFRSALNVSINEQHYQISSDHLLDLIHKCYSPPSPRPVNRETIRPLQTLECATVLRKGGILFRADTSRNLLDLEFAEGLFKVPRFVINDLTVVLFTNLVAFEQCCRADAQYISAYIFLMDFLLNTAADAEMLERTRIIKNNLGGYEDISIFLKNICKQIFLREFYFEGLCQEVMTYYNSPWVRSMAALREDYFGKPLASITVVAATVLLIFTLIQTVYSVLSYTVVRRQ